MNINFTGSIQCSEDCEGIYVNSITMLFESGMVLSVDRDTTEYTVDEDGNFSMDWINVYIWNYDEEKGEGFCSYLNEDSKLYKSRVIKAVADVEEDINAHGLYRIVIDTVDGQEVNK